MSLLQRGLMFVLAAGTLVLPSTNPPETRAGGRAAAPVETKTESLYTPADKEYYLDENQVDFIRPGLKVTIGTVTDMAPGKKPIVEITMTDDLNQPLDRLGGTTPGVVALRFIPATWDAATGYYDDLLNSSNGNPTRDNTGVWVDLGAGKYKYTFAAAMPNFDVNKPMTLACTGSRNMVDYLGKSYYVNVFKDFVPATGAAATTWAVTTTAKCNACHDPVVGHGSNYREAKTCALCHNPKDMVGNLQEFDMGIWHRIHSSNLEDVGEITYPNYYLQNCEACHTPTAAQGTVYLTKPGANSCGGCHADIDFAAGVGHPAQANDSACANCHVPDSGQEFDASVKGAHVLPLESKQLKGLKADIVSVTNTAPGQNPIVTFKLYDSTGNLDPKPFGSNANVLLAGPTTDYATWPNIRESVSTATFNGTTSVYTMKWKVPDTFKGTISYSMDVRRSVTVNGVTFNEGRLQPDLQRRCHGHRRPPPERRQPGQVPRLPRLAPAPRRAASRGGRVPPLPQPEQRRQLAPDRGRRQGPRVDPDGAHDPPDPHGRRAHAALHDLRLRRDALRLHGSRLPRRPAQLPGVPHVGGDGEPSDAEGDAERHHPEGLLHAAGARYGRLPRLPRHA